MKFAYMPDTHFGVYDQDPPTPDAAADAFAQIIEEAVLAEELGFDGVFLPERHIRGENVHAIAADRCGSHRCAHFAHTHRHDCADAYTL